MKKIAKIILVNAVLIIAVLALFEGFFYALVHNPDLLKKCPQKIRNTIGYLYANERNTIQFDPACARYDSGLGYTLRPGACTFSGREFTSEYRINSLGVRDDEESLHHPEIIVAGDSFAMGWGVNQDETFAQRLEKKSGTTVLNTAISSYGTAREMMILKRVSTDRLRWLVIQYCGNDLEENRSFYLHGNRLETMGSEEYRRYADLNLRVQAYFPGKYLWMKVKKKIDEFNRTKDTEKPLDRDETDLFINAIVQSGLDLRQTKLIVFVMNGRNPDDNRAFPEALKKRIAGGGYPPFIAEMAVLDFSTTLKNDHFYILDDHMNSRGHDLVADALLHIIKP
jgi:hypothetical protein